MEQDMSKFILGIILIGITLVIGIYISATMQTGFRQATAGTYINDTLTAVTETGQSFTVYSWQDGSCGIATSVINATDGVAIPAANYTQTGCSIKYSGPTGKFNNTNWKVTYPYSFNNETSSSTAALNLTTALSGGSAWITILVVVGFAVIVLGMLSEGLGKAAKAQGTLPTY